MNHIQLFEDFSKSHKFKIDRQTINYINGHISQEEYESYMFEGINEGIVGDAINWIKEKVLNAVCTFILGLKNFVNKVLQNGIVKKFINIVNKVIEYLKKFKEKYPKLTKFIFVGIILILLILISSQSAEAAEIVKQSGSKSKLITDHVDNCNAAIDFIETHKDWIKSSIEHHSGEKNSVEISEIIFGAQTYMQDMKDGIQSPDMSYSRESIAVAKSALSWMSDHIKEANDKNDVDAMNQLLNSIKEGSKHYFQVSGLRNF